ncbi:MAG: NHL domain-containing protein [Acidobacteriaceae bacterium]
MMAVFAVVVTALIAPGALAQAVSGAVVLVSGVINTVAGDGTAGYSGDGGPATSAEFNSPDNVTVDSAGNLYIADYYNNRIRKVTASTGDISTVAGNGTQGYSGNGGLATSAELSFPEDVAVDSAGNLYIADAGNHVIRMVNASTGIISTVAGDGACGYSGIGGPATSATLCPQGVAVDSAGNLYIADGSLNRILKVYASTGIITTVAGDGGLGYSGDGGPATSAELGSPNRVAVDSAGNLYIADLGNSRIRKVTASTGIITTVAGDGTVCPGSNCGDGGPATSAELNLPWDVAMDSAGDIYIADANNNVIRKVDASTGDISTVAGPGNGTIVFGGDGGPATSAELSSPIGVAVDSAGNFYIADSGHQRIRKVSTSATVPSFPATAIGTTSASQNIFVQLTAASGISSITVPKAQNNAQEFTVGTVSGCAVGGASNPADTVCTVPVTFSPQYPGPRTGALTITNGSSVVGMVGLSGAGQGPEIAQLSGGLAVVAGGSTNLSAIPSTTPQSATSANLGDPRGVTVDVAGNLYIADYGFNLIADVQAATGQIVLVAGRGPTVPTTTPEAATNADLSSPFSTAVDGAGNLFIADSGNQLVEKVDASTGEIEVVAGSAGNTSSSNIPSTTPEPATTAQFSTPMGLAVDAGGNLYIADQGNDLVAKVDLAGEIVAVAGCGANCGTVPSTTQEPASSAKLNGPSGIAVDATGNLYIADSGNNLVEKVNNSGQIVVVAGGGSTSPSTTPNSATSAQLNGPVGVAVDAAENIYIVDSSNGLIEKVDTSGHIVVVAGGGSTVPSTTVESATSAKLLNPAGIAIDGAGNLYIADSGNSVVEKVSNGLIEISTAALLFPNTNVGATSATQALTLANIGNEPLNLASLITATDFPLQSASTCTVTANNAQTLASGDACDLAYAFQPTISGALSETATLTDNNLNGTNAVQTISFSGTATATTGTGAATTTTLATSNANISAGASVTFTATVTSSITGTPTGTVTFMGGTTTLGTGTLSGATATYTTSSLAAGVYTITAQYSGDTNFAPSTSAAITETVTAGSPTFSTTAANNGNITIPSGSGGTLPVVITATGGYTGTVNLTCAPSSPAFTCSVNPTSLTFTASGPTSQPAGLTIVTSVTTAGLMLPARPFPDSSTPIYSAMALWLPGSFLALLGLRRRKKNSKSMRKFLMLVLLFAGIGSAASLTGCGSIQKAINCIQGNSSCTNNTTNTPTPAGSYKVIVTATDGTTKNTTTVNVTVQ